MPDNDEQLAQGTVDFRNEERLHRTGREPGHVPERSDSDPPSLPAPAPGFLTDSPGASRPALHEVSAREREDDRRRDGYDDEGFFCHDPFGEWIQSILDDSRGRPA